MPQVMMSVSEALEFLTANHEGRLATVDAIGQPYITPLNYIIQDGNIYFHCSHEGKKIENIASNPRVCFEVSRSDKYVISDQPCKCSTRYTSVLAFGTAQLVADSSEKVDILTKLTKRISRRETIAQIDAKMAASCTVVKIVINDISGKRNVDASG